MDENETDKASQRANLIEQRMFEITLSSIDTLKHATALEIHKSQNEMKKKLRKYRERQREIVRSRRDFDNDPIEELIARQLRNKAKAREKTRPKTSVGTHRLSPQSPRSPHTEKVPLRAKSTPPDFGSDFDSESDDIDSTFMIDHQKSKIDLRPKTAMDIVRKGTPFEKYVSWGRLGTAARQTRYFDDDELKDREHFYRHLVEKRIHKEKDNTDSLDNKVAQFCGNETIQTMTKKIQSRRKLFTTSTEWDTNNRSNVKQTERCSDRRQKVKKAIRPKTSLGIRRTDSSHSFNTPSYISTSRY